MSAMRKVLRSAGVIGVSTLLSRFLGLARDMVMANLFGTSFVAEAFYVAFMIPALLRRLVGEGSLTVAFIPVFTKFKKRYGEEAAARFFRSFWTLMSLVLLAMVAMGVIFSREIVGLFANPAFQQDREMFNLAVLMTQQMFPYLFFIGLTALAMGVLNSYRHFFSASFHPVLLNVSWITCVLLLHNKFEQPGLSIVIGVVIGGVLQLALQWPYLRKVGMSFVPRFEFRHPAIRKIGKLMLPSGMAVGVIQINTLIATYFVTAFDGARTQLFYANRLTEFPYAIFSLAIANAVLPLLSEQAGAKDYRALRQTLGQGLRMVAFIIIPASIGLALVSTPIVHIFFEHGEFSSVDTSQTASMLIMFCLSLWAVAGLRIVVQVFYAVEDMVTPLWAAAIGMTVNAYACYYLSQRMGREGVALGISLATIANFLVLWLRLPSRAGKLRKMGLPRTIITSLVSSLPMAALVIWINRLDTWQEPGHTALKVLLLGAMVAGGGILFLVTAKLLKSAELNELTGAFSRRLGTEEDSE